jgi:hypothetical protein
MGCWTRAFSFRAGATFSRATGPSALTRKSLPCYVADPVRVLRSSIALLAAGFVGWASIADNAAVCVDDLQDHGRHHGDDAPAAPHCCLSCPCQTPTDARPVTTAVRRVSTIAKVITVAEAAPISADIPAPPTPPPTLLA